MTVAAFQKDDACWSVEENQKVFEANGRLRVFRQTLSLPGDRTIDDYYQIDLPSFASIYGLTEDGRVLVLRQYKHGVGHVCLTLPGGQIDPGEDAEFSARRELLEETGYGGGRWQRGPSLVVHGNQKIAMAHIFVARQLIKLGEANSDDLEDAVLLTLSRDELKEALTRGAFPITSHVATAGIGEMLLAGP